MGMVLTSFIHKFHNGNPCDKIKAYTYTYNIIFDDMIFRDHKLCTVDHIKPNSNVRDT